MVKELNRHPDEGDIEKYAMGLLREVEVAGFEEHLLICEECQRHLAEADEYVVAMRGAVQCSNRKGQGQPRGSRWKALRAISALAAVAVLMLGIGWWSGKSSLTGSAPFAVSLQATRGAGIAAYAPADTWLLVRLELAGLPGLPSYRLEMVDGAGTVIWQGAVAAIDATAESKVPGTRAGVYFIRVYAPAGGLLREFGLRIKR